MSGIQVLSRVQRIIVDSNSAVSVTNAGPVGPVGFKGDQGIQGLQGFPGSDAAVTEPNVEAIIGPRNGINGYLGLDVLGLVPDIRIPESIARDTEAQAMADGAQVLAQAYTDSSVASRATQVSLDAEVAARIAADNLLVTTDTAQLITGLKTISPSAVGAVGLIVKGLVGQTVNPFEVRDSANAIQLAVTAAGQILGGAGLSVGSTRTTPADGQLRMGGANPGLYWDVGGTGGQWLFYTAGSTGTMYFRDIVNGRMHVVMRAGAVGVAFTQFTDQVQILNQAATRMPFFVRGAPSQTADLQQWQDSAGVVRAKVSPIGTVSALSATKTVSLLTNETMGILNCAATGDHLHMSQTANRTTLPQSGVIIGPGATPSTSGSLQVTSNPYNQPQLATRAMVAQTTDVWLAQNSAGVRVAAVSPTGVFTLANSAPPATNIVDGGQIYAEDGALKWRGSAGTVTTLAAA